jgi:hypothetical protein
MLHDSQEDPTMAVFSDILGRVAPDNGNGSTQRNHHTKLHLRGYNPEQFPVAVLKHVAAELQTDTMSFRFQSPVHVQSDSNATGQNQPRSIYVSTAEQIGLLPRYIVLGGATLTLSLCTGAHCRWRLLQAWCARSGDPVAATANIRPMQALLATMAFESTNGA